MKSKSITVLDFGSSKLTCLVGSKGVNNTFKIFASSECEYPGFMDGEFVNENDLFDNIATVIDEINSKLKTKITQIFVGVPAEFCFCKVGRISKNFRSRQKITTKVINDLFAQEEIEFEVPNQTIINKSPISYSLDDQQQLFDVVGGYANTISAKVGFISADNRFIDTVNSCLNRLEIRDINYICSTLAEGNYLLDPEERVGGAILVDCGYISTSVSKVVGDALIMLKSFSLGGAFITSDLSQVLDIDFSQAEELKRKLIICVEPQKNEYYEVLYGNEILRLPMAKSNDIARARIDMIAQYIKKCLDGVNCDNIQTIYLTGGGLCYIKGIKDYLSKVLDKKIVITMPISSQLNRPELSGVIALLDTALQI